MRLTRYDDAAAYYQRVESFLAAHEAMHCLPLGLCATMRSQPVGDGPPYLAVVERDDGAVAAVILRTPPNNVIVTLMADAEREAALALAANDLRATYGALPGAVGPTGEVAAFAARWRTLTGHAAHLATHERIYQLKRVVPVHGVPGRFRRAAPADRALLVRWLDAFHAEALPGGIALNAEAAADRMLTAEGRGGYLWDDGEPVSLAGYNGPTPHGIRVGPVYTPPERRGKGFASACVAALSQRLLDDGRRFVFLFTDLANPTANHIYQAIGYQPVGDVDEYRFTARA